MTLSTPDFPAPVPTPAPEPKKGGALKIILIVLGIILAIIILVFGLLAYGCYRIAHSIEHHGHGNSVSILGSNISTVDSGTLTSADLGTDIYPGAAGTDQGSKIDLPTASVTTGIYLTADPVSKVEAFYQNKLGVGAPTFGTTQSVVLSKKVSDKETVLVTITNKNTDDGKTKVIIQHTLKKQ